MLEFIFTQLLTANIVPMIILGVIVLIGYLFLGNYISKKHCNYLKTLMDQGIHNNSGKAIKFPVKFIRIFIIIAWPLWYMIYATLIIFDSCIVPILMPIWGIVVFSMFFIITAPLACIFAIIMGPAGWLIVELHWLFGIYPNFRKDKSMNQKPVDEYEEWENKLRFPKS